MVYSVSVERAFVAQHHLTVPDCGAENEPHSHTYTAEVQARGASLDEHNYLIDVVEFEGAVDEVVGRYTDSMLNEAPGFEGNPSAEQFARVFAEDVSEIIEAPEVDSIVVRMQEDRRATVSYRHRL
jgi:6-pyruvoyltetrahydropterin/6-carboxytetrahydropterin synthase